MHNNNNYTDFSHFLSNLGSVCLKSEIHEIHRPPTKSTFVQPKLISQVKSSQVK